MRRKGFLLLIAYLPNVVLMVIKTDYTRGPQVVLEMLDARERKSLQKINSDEV